MCIILVLKVKHEYIRLRTVDLITLILQAIYLRIKKLLGEIFYIHANLDKKNVKRLTKELSHFRSTVDILAREFHETVPSTVLNPVLSEKLKWMKCNIHEDSKGIKNEPRRRGLKKTWKRHLNKTDKPPIIIVERNTGYAIFSVVKQYPYS
jgi:hypothetical protein